MKPILSTTPNGLELWLSGFVVENEEKELYNWYGYDAVCPQDVITALRETDGKALTVKINGYGGSIFAASTIFEEFMSHNSPIHYILAGLAASAFSYIPMAGARAGCRVSMAPTAMMMIHNVQGGREGDYRDMEHEAQRLRAANRAVANAYRVKTGLSDEKIADLMENETWLSAWECMGLGLVDEVLFDESDPETEQPPHAVLNVMKRSAGSMLNCVKPPNLEKLKALQLQPEPNPAETVVQLQAKAQLTLEIEKNRFGGM